MVLKRRAIISTQEGSAYATILQIKNKEEKPEILLPFVIQDLIKSVKTHF